MMRHNYSIIASLMIVMSTITQDVYGNGWEFHRELLKNKFDTSYWENVWENDLWHIRSVFVDMDGDGTEEMMAITTSEEDRMGDYWKIWKCDNAGRFKLISFSGEIYFSCHSTSFYRVSYSNRADTVVGLGMNANIEKDCGNGDRCIVRSTPDCVFVVMPGNTFMLREIQPNVDTAFCRKDVVSIERLYPEWYFGFDFNPPKDVPHSPYTSWMPYKLPKGDLRRGGGVSEADDFHMFVEEYRRKVKMGMGDEKKVTVYAVHLDADNDGDADCYVSSDPERVEDGTFKWSLFLRHGKTLSNAKRVVYPVENHKELCQLNPQIIASRDSFCRIIRFDVNPLFVVLDDTVKRTVIRDAITGHETHRVEKLGCVEYPEK